MTGYHGNYEKPLWAATLRLEGVRSVGDGECVGGRGEEMVGEREKKKE